MPKPPVNPPLNPFLEYVLDYKKPIESLLSGIRNEDTLSMTSKEFTDKIVDALNQVPRLQKSELKKLMSRYRGLSNLHVSGKKEQKDKEILREKAIRASAIDHYERTSVISKYVGKFGGDTRTIASMVYGTSFSTEMKGMLLNDLMDPKKRQLAANLILKNYASMDTAPYLKKYTDEEFAGMSLPPWPENIRLQKRS